MGVGVGWRGGGVGKGMVGWGEERRAAAARREGRGWRRGWEQKAGEMGQNGEVERRAGRAEYVVTVTREGVVGEGWSCC